MTIIQSIILGIIQGITEFLPISSSGHLVIVPYLLGWQIPESQIFPFDVLVQIGTLIAVIIFYWKDLIEIGTAMISGIKEKKPFETIPARTGWFTILATIPAGIIGLLLKDVIEDTFSNPRIAAILLLITATLLLISEKIGKQSRDLRKLNWIDAIVMGISQALAVFPGISRSGSTISGGLSRNLKRKTAGQFAFLMAIPVMGAAGLLGVVDLVSVPDLADFLPVMGIGFLTSGIVGYFAIKWLLNYISNNTLTPFAYYCFFIGTGTLILSFLNPVVSPEIQTGSIETTYTVTYQSEAEWMLVDMNKCSGEIQNGSIIFQKGDTPLDREENYLHISYGESSLSSAHSYQLGQDAYVLAGNNEHPIDQLSYEAMQKIISGEISNGNDLEKNCSNCIFEENESDLIYHVWAYPALSEISNKIEKIYAINHSPTSTIAPTPNLMKQALNSDTTSLGFLPRKMLDGNLKEINITGSEEINSEIPLLISTNTKPDKQISNWIVCLQNAIE